MAESSGLPGQFPSLETFGPAPGVGGGARPSGPGPRGGGVAEAECRAPGQAGEGHSPLAGNAALEPLSRERSGSSAVPLGATGGPLLPPHGGRPKWKTV